MEESKEHNFQTNNNTLHSEPARTMVCLIIVILGSLFFQFTEAATRSSSVTTNFHESSSFVSTNLPSDTLSSNERGKLLSENYSAQELYEAYESVYQDYDNKAFGSNDWKILHNTGDGVEVSILEHENDENCPYVRMTVIFDSPVEVVWDFLSITNWNEAFPKIDPFFDGIQIFEQETLPEKGADLTLLWKKSKRLLAFRKRDFLFVSVTNPPREDGMWVAGTVSIRTPRYPRVPGYTRAYQDSISFYEPLDGGKRTKLTAVCRLDLNDSSADGEGGLIPMWLYLRTIGNTGALVMQGMRREVEKIKFDEPKAMNSTNTTEVCSEEEEEESASSEEEDLEEETILSERKRQRWIRNIFKRPNRPISEKYSQHNTETEKDK